MRGRCRPPHIHPSHLAPFSRAAYAPLTRYDGVVRVCIDAFPLLVRSAGVKNYLYYWIEHLRRLAGDDAIRLFPPLGALPALDHERPLAGRVRTFSALASLAAMNYVRVPLADWFAPRADIFHTANLIHHPPQRMRLTTTVHDVTSRIMPELHSTGNQRAGRGFESTLRRAHRIIAVSENTKRDVVRMLGLDAERIHVIHSGVAEAFFHAGPTEAGIARAAYGLQRPYVLFVGAIEPRKNVGTLLDAWAALAPSLREEFELVLAGLAGWAGPKLVSRLSASGPGVRYLGYVPERHLAGLTAGAAVFVYPSLYEGFGFPVAQAMAAGVAVVTSNVSSLPEVAGEAAVLVDPRSPSALREALSRLLLSPAECALRSEAGRVRARRFTWEECARRSLEFFRAAAG